MGSEAKTILHRDREKLEGKALLETEELIFRGADRLRIPLREMKNVSASGGELLFEWQGQAHRLTLGGDAAKWAEKIRNPKSVIEKLGVKSGQRVSVIGKVEPAFTAQLASLGVDLSTRSRKESDVIFLAAETRSDLDRIRDLVTSLAPAGALWVIRPKGKKEITEGETMAAGKAAGLVDVKVVKFSEARTAEKFVIPIAQRRLR